MKFIQFIGTQRSGSNLLRLMLSQLQGIYAPHPPHILKTFYPLLAKYGNLNSKKNFEFLIDDVISWIKLNPVKWNEIPTKNQILEKVMGRSLFQVFRSVYEINALKEKNIKYWCCKSLYNLNFFDNNNFRELEPIYIYIYRDGRDVASSFLKAAIGDKHIYFLAKKWYRDQKTSLKIKENCSRENFFSIKYEDLLSNPKKIIQNFCDKYLIEYNDNFIEFYKSDDSIIASSSGKLWKNLSKPLIKNNKEKYIDELSANQILLFESINYRYLKMLNYKLKYDNSKFINSFSKSDLLNYNILNNKLRDEFFSKISSMELSKREMQLKFLEKVNN